MSLLERVHIGKGKVIRAEQWANASVLDIKSVHVVRANVSIAIQVEHIKAKSELLSVTFGHHMTFDVAQVLREIQIVHSTEIQSTDNLFRHGFAIFLQKDKKKK